MDDGWMCMGNACLILIRVIAICWLSVATWQKQHLTCCRLDLLLGCYNCPIHLSCRGSPSNFLFRFFFHLFLHVHPLVLSDWGTRPGLSWFILNGSSVCPPSHPSQINKIMRSTAAFDQLQRIMQQCLTQRPSWIIGVTSSSGPDEWSGHVKEVFRSGGRGMFIIVPSWPAFIVNALIFMKCAYVFTYGYSIHGTSKEKHSLKYSMQESLVPPPWSPKWNIKKCRHTT